MSQRISWVVLACLYPLFSSYGELGYTIIHQTLYDLFPPDQFFPNSTLPLDPIEFIQHVLIPETAVHLISHDLMQSRSQAIATMRQSVEYGVAMFPDDGYNAGDSIVWNRAMSRRRVLQEEEAAPGNTDHPVQVAGGSSLIRPRMKARRIQAAQ